MVKSVLGVNYQGLRDWLIQRVTAIYLAVYSIVLLIYLMLQPQVDYAVWHSLFACMWVKIATVLLVLCLLVHAWVGMWTVFTDYVKSFVLNLILQVLIFLALIAFFFQALLILWGV